MPEIREVLGDLHAAGGRAKVDGVCLRCVFWAPDTRRMLANRKRNVAAAPSVRLHPCPRCGGTEYMLSEILVPPPTWWERFTAWLRGALAR